MRKSDMQRGAAEWADGLREALVAQMTGIRRLAAHIAQLEAEREALNPSSAQASAHILDLDGRIKAQRVEIAGAEALERDLFAELQHAQRAVALLAE